MPESEDPDEPFDDLDERIAHLHRSISAQGALARELRDDRQVDDALVAWAKGLPDGPDRAFAREQIQKRAGAQLDRIAKISKSLGSLEVEWRALMEEAGCGDLTDAEIDNLVSEDGDTDSLAE